MSKHSIRHGSKGSLPEGGEPTSVTDGGRVHYVKNEGTSDDKTGGDPSVQTGRSGVNKVKGK